MQYWLACYYYTVITFFPFFFHFYYYFFSFLVGHRRVGVGCLQLAEETLTPGCDESIISWIVFDELKRF